MRLKQWLWLVLVLAAPGLVSGAEDKSSLGKSTLFYVQLIQGSNQEKPPTPKAKPIGPKLRQRLVPVFRWKSYWEINRHEVKVVPRQVKKLDLKVRVLEIEMLPDGQVEMRLYQKGKLVRTLRQKLKEGTLAIMGGADGDDHAWFVVVRRDKPE